MVVFRAFDENVQVNGETVLSVLDGMDNVKEIAVEILKKNNIDNPSGGEWYSQQDWLNAFKEISEKVGETTLKMIGNKILENANWPPSIDSVEKALISIDQAYHMNHRNGNIGFYKFEKISDHSGKMICENPYPDAFDLGIIEAAAKKFAIDPFKVNVKLEDSVTRGKGANSSTYLINW